MPSGKHATGHTRRSGQLWYRTDAGKPSGSVRAFGVNRIVPLGWSEGIQRHPAALLLALLLLARWSQCQGL